MFNDKETVWSCRQSLVYTRVFDGNCHLRSFQVVPNLVNVRRQLVPLSIRLVERSLHLFQFVLLNPEQVELKHWQVYALL
jgi:hypothetical protein